MAQKIIDFNNTVYKLCSDDLLVAEILAKVGFTDILKPGMINTAGRFMTIPKGAALKKIDLEKVKKAFREHGFKIKE